MRQVGQIVARLKHGQPLELRHANPYLQEALELENIVYTVEELEAKKGVQLFPNSQPMVLEIGCYMGKTVLELADKNPNLNVLGLDITYKRTVKSGRKIKRLGIENARIGICDARHFITVVPERSFAGVCVFFPDPWKKLKRRKHRLLNEEFLSSLSKIVTHDGFFWFKTDDLEYFEEASKFALQNGWKLEEPKSTEPQELTPSVYKTAFEQLFESKNLPTYGAIFRNGGAL